MTLIRSHWNVILVLPLSPHSQPASVKNVYIHCSELSLPSFIDSGRWDRETEPRGLQRKRTRSKFQTVICCKLIKHARYSSKPVWKPLQRIVSSCKRFKQVVGTRPCTNHYMWRIVSTEVNVHTCILLGQAFSFADHLANEQATIWYLSSSICLNKN